MATTTSAEETRTSAGERPATAPEVPHPDPVIPRKRANRLFLVIGAVVVLLLLAYGAYLLLTAGKEGTDDAQVAADVVPLAARVGGEVIAVHVIENQPVHRGDLIAEVDPRDAQVKAAQAQGDLETARAQETQAEANAAV